MHSRTHFAPTAKNHQLTVVAFPLMTLSLFPVSCVVSFTGLLHHSLHILCHFLFTVRLSSALVLTAVIFHDSTVTLLKLLKKNVILVIFLLIYGWFLLICNDTCRIFFFLQSDQMCSKTVEVILWTPCSRNIFLSVFISNLHYSPQLCWEYLNSKQVSENSKFDINTHFTICSTLDTT